MGYSGHSAGRRFALAGVLFWALGAAALAEPAGPPIPIGVQYPLTGPSSELGQGFQYGAQLAVSEINAHGGIEGRELKLIWVDDKSTQDGAVTAIQRLTTGDNVLLVWGGSSSNPSIAMLPRMKVGPTPFYVGFASDPRVLQPFSKFVSSGASAPVSAVVEGLSSFVATMLRGRIVATMFCDQANCKVAAPWSANACRSWVRPLRPSNRFVPAIPTSPGRSMR